MSLSWIENLTLCIHPSNVTLTRKGWRGAAESWRARVLPATGGQKAWEPAVTAAQALLAEHSRRGNRLQVVLADSLVRYAVLPWSEAVLGHKPRRAMARALFRHNLGDAAEQLDITLGRAAFGLNSLAAGVPQALLDGLRQAARAAKVRLASVQPRLNAELLASRATLADGCIVFPDDAWLTLLYVCRGNPGLLRNHRCSGSAIEALPGFLAADCSAARVKKLLVFSRQAWPESLGDWRIECRQPLTDAMAHA